jgi:hypothetical protein
MIQHRREAIMKALEAYRASADTRTLQVEYRGVSRSLEVVTISPDIPILNPNNSRLRAQLISHPEKSVVSSDPESEKAQALLGHFLRNTEKFDSLKTQLVDFKQSEPGIISRDGLLVNGNTRLTAIRELGWTGFDVAVLPEDATDEDFFNIEMTLQLRKLVHQNYTFTNELLLVENYLERSGSEEATIKAMQWIRGGKKRLRESQGHLQLIEDIIALNPSLTYSFFDNKEEMIKNLYAQYSAVYQDSPERAETLKNARILGLFLGLNKDEIREINEFFIEDEVLSDGEDSAIASMLTDYRTTEVVSNSLDALLGTSDGPAVDLKRLVQDVASTVVNSDGQVDTALIDAKHKQLHNKFKTASRQIREDRVTSEMRSEPIDYLRDVTKKIQDLADRIPELFRDEGFDKGKFSHQARKTKQSIEQLSGALNRALGE